MTLIPKSHGNHMSAIPQSHDSPPYPFKSSGGHCTHLSLLSTSSVCTSASALSSPVWLATCLVPSAPKLRMYSSYSDRGCRSSRSIVTTSNSIIDRSSYTHTIGIHNTTTQLRESYLPPLLGDSGHFLLLFFLLDRRKVDKSSRR